MNWRVNLLEMALCTDLSREHQIANGIREFVWCVVKLLIAFQRTMQKNVALKMLLQWQTQIRLGGFKMDMVKNREIRSKHVKAASVLCNSCMHLKKHVEYRKILCRVKGVQIVRINQCYCFERKVIKADKPDMLAWCD